MAAGNVDSSSMTVTLPASSEFRLDRSSATPLHQQLFGYFKQLIETGQLSPGSRLQPELELGERYGVSRGTVRQAMRSLSEAGLIRRETKNGTVVSAPPRQATMTSRIIGVVFPETRDAFCLDVMKGVQAACRERSYHAAFGYSHHSSALERTEITRMREAGFSGVLVLPHADATLFKELLAGGYPFVCVDQSFADVASDFVGVDNVAASLGATEHLLKLGHRRIAFVCQHAELTQAPSTVQDRYRGYRKALASWSVPFETPWLLGTENDADYTGFLARAGRPSAAVAANDFTAVKLMDAAKELGVAVPEDLAVVGFDDIPLALGAHLTTVVQPSSEIGSAAAQLLIDGIEGKRTSPRRLLLPTRLAVRSSCGASLAPAGKV
jgi:DNA-binding LacI/PurR family transcriptional regulator